MYMNIYVYINEYVVYMYMWVRQNYCSIEFCCSALLWYIKWNLIIGPTRDPEWNFEIFVISVSVYQLP